MPGPKMRVARFDAPLRAGSALRFEVGVGPLRLPWELTVETCEPLRCFVDVQTGRGPMRAWRHTHAFEEAPDGTRVIDRIEYALPLGWLGEIAAAVFGRLAFALMFAYRRRATRRLLEARAL